LKFERLPKVLPGRHAPVPAPLAGKRIAGIAHDSRRIKPGWVFLAIRGHLRDGATFAQDAVDRGAAAVVAEAKLPLPPETPQFVVQDARRALAALANAFYGRPSRRLEIVGVTGTNGKTTTCFMLRSILEATGARCGLLGSIRYETGRRSLPASITTPESVDIQEFLSEMAAEGMKYAVMEVSSHALCMRRVDFIQFAAGVFTNLAPEHMDYHGTPENYRRAKERLFTRLGPCNHAVLNADDPAGKHMVERSCARRMMYGLRHAADVRAVIEEATLDGIAMRLTLGGAAMPVRLPVIGEHNVYNALAAAAAAHGLGLGLDAIREGLETLSPVAGRLETVPCEKDCRVLVNYAHTDHALAAVLGSLRKVTAKRILVVFGAGGDRDRDKRPRMGRVAERHADRVWITSDNPRSEAPDDIIKDIVAGTRQPRRLCIQPDRAAAIAEAIQAAETGDLVLIAGKGHERTQRFRDTVVPFDDRDAVRAAARTGLTETIAP
jgi:UDP-N-acetylmuramoyl-L-alanyl-D-glutamate--2,6-diaminopimelate ligase